MIPLNEVQKQQLLPDDGSQNDGYSIVVVVMTGKGRREPSRMLENSLCFGIGIYDYVKI